MPITIPSTANYRTVSITFEDVDEEATTRTFLVSGDMLDVELVNLMTSIEAITNAKITRATVADTRVFAGFRTSAIEEPYINTSDYLALAFEEVDPINPNKKVSRAWMLPAPLRTGLYLAKGGLNTETYSTGATAAEHAQRIIDLLVANIVYQAHDGAYYVGMPYVSNVWVSKDAVKDGR